MFLLKELMKFAKRRRGIIPDTDYRLGLYFNLGEVGTEF
jgi:hypothetical protein